MTIKNKIIISLALSGLMIFLTLSSASATESAWQNLNPILESGLTGSVTNCNPLTVANGSVAAYPSCAITCNSGYTLSGSACVASGGSSGGGGGGGGGNITYCSGLTYSGWGACVNSLHTRSVATRLPASCTLTTTQQISLQESCTASPADNSNVPEPETPADTPADTSGQDLINSILDEAVIVNSGQAADILSHLGNSADQSREDAGALKYKKILAGDKTLSAAEVAAVNRFIVYGTRTTQILGEGERAGVINSYLNAYGKLPNTDAEWADAIKIGNGRWPNERSTKAEAQAKIEFKKVYARNAVMTNNIDQNAIMVIAYGLLPSQRNLASEKTAIKTFKWVYGHNPVSALAWNVVRAIAYSGAKR